MTALTILAHLSRAALVAGTLALGVALPSAGTASDHVSQSAIAVQGRGAWLWEDHIWQTRRGRVLDMAEALDLRRLFIGIKMKDGQIVGREALRRFVAEAHRRGIAVLGVEGDPLMVTRRGRNAAIKRVEVFRAYQASVGKSERLDGLQYDIEPASLPNFDVHDPEDLKRWSMAYRELRNAWGGPLDIVLPYWIGDWRTGEAFVRRIAPHAQSFTIMAYRDTPPAIIDVATELLSQGAALSVPVVVALEMGPTDEGDHVSFDGDLDALLKAVKQTRRTFAEWESFSGYAIHGLPWPGSGP